MKFVKGMVIGSIVSAGIIMLCNENMTYTMPYSGCFLVS